MTQRKLILYISMSLDGFLATEDDDLSWLSMVEKEGEDYGYNDFCSTVDTYIVGKKTYDVVLNLTGGEFPQSKLYDCYIITHQQKKNTQGVTFYNGNIAELVKKLKQEDGKNIYCDGGGQIVNLLMKENLIDEYIISIIPIMLGNGKKLFLGDTKRFPLKLKTTNKFDSGLVQLHYERG